MALTLTCGAHSQAIDFVNDSTAPFALEITLWLENPWPAATDENSTTLLIFYFINILID